MIVSINGMDNSGKTTQIKELMRLYPDYYIKTLHIKNTKSFNQEKYDFDWWFNPNIKEDFVKVILESLSERNEIAKSLYQDDKVILYDKGNDFYEARILATLILKGETLESSLEMLQKIKSQYDLENIEQLKLFLLPGKYPKKENFNSERKIIYNAYLELNKLLLGYKNINYQYILPNELNIVTNKIDEIIRKESEKSICKKLILKK